METTKPERPPEKQERKMPMNKLAKVVMYPITIPVELAYKIFPHDKRKSHAAVGVLYAMLGAYMASLEIHYIPHFLWDGFAYSVHGMGIAPGAKLLLEYFHVEV